MLLSQVHVSLQFTHGVRAWSQMGNLKTNPLPLPEPSLSTRVLPSCISTICLDTCSVEELRRVPAVCPLKRVVDVSNRGTILAMDGTLIGHHAPSQLIWKKGGAGEQFSHPLAPPFYSAPASAVLWWPARAFEAHHPPAG